MAGVGQGDSVGPVMFLLDRYARFFQTSETLTPGTEDSWEFYDATEQALEMTLMKNHIVLIHHGKTLLHKNGGHFGEELKILEVYDPAGAEIKNTSYCVLQLEHSLLIDSSNIAAETLDLSESSALRGVCRGSSMLIICRLKTHTRRFRVKFKEHESVTAIENCSKMANILSKYFPLKISNTENDMTKETSMSQTLTGEVTLGQISQVLMKKGSESLPMAYNAIRQTQPANIDSIVRLCLADPSFPAFVESVEKTLLNIQGECK